MYISRRSKPKKTFGLQALQQSDSYSSKQKSNGYSRQRNRAISVAEKERERFLLQTKTKHQSSTTTILNQNKQGSVCFIQNTTEKPVWTRRSEMMSGWTCVHTHCM
jgi:hypothetical protein